MGCLTGATAVFQWLMSLVNNRIAYEVCRDIRDEAYLKINTLPLSYLDDRPYGEVVSRMITDVEQFADGLLMGFTQLFTGVVTILGTIGLMLSIHAGITLSLIHI